MRLGDIARELDLRDLTPEIGEGDATDIVAGHASDLLSDVLANAPRGGVLVTIHMHMNVIAVAANVELAAVIFASAMEPEDAVRTKAVAEGIRLFASQDSTFDVVGRLYALGLRARHA